MRITPKQYAEGLYEALGKAEGSARQEIIDRFFSVLIRDRRMKDIRAILSSLRDSIDREEKRITVRVRSAFPFIRETLQEIEQQAGEIFGANHVQLEPVIDTNIRGGIVLETKDATYDASVQGCLIGLGRILMK